MTAYRQSTSSRAGATARAAKQIIKQTAASLTGKQRGPDQRVRRDSYDIDDPRARVFKPIGDGTVADARSWLEDLVEVAQDFAVWSRNRHGGRGWLTPYDVDVFRAFCLGPKLDYKTGRLEPPLAWIEKVTGFSRQAVVDGLRRLRQFGFLSWVRRSQRTGNDGEVGPQREQITNAYHFDLAELATRAKRAYRGFMDRRARRRRRAANAAPATPGPETRVPKDPALAEALAALGERVEERESLKPPLCPLQDQGISGRASRGAV